MAMIYITCPDRTADISMPAWAMIAILDLGEFSWGQRGRGGGHRQQRDAAGGWLRAAGRAGADRTEGSFARRLEGLSDDARRLLLVAAAEPVGDPLPLLRASERLGIAVAVVGAETDGLFAIGDRVTFRHPLVRSAVYRSGLWRDAARSSRRWPRRPTA